MGNDRMWMGILGVTLLLAGGGCKRAAAAAEGNASEQATPTNAANGAAAATTEAQPTKAATKLTAGELSDGKQKVKFTIALPEGMQAVNDEFTQGMANYRKGPKEFEGYNLTIFIDRDGKRSLAPAKAAVLAEAERGKTTKKAALLSQGDLDDGGWYISASFEEGGKPLVMLMSRVVHGDLVLMCRGGGEGEVAKTPEATAKVLIGACKSLTVTSP